MLFHIMRRLLPVRKCRSSEKWTPLLCSSGWVLLNHCICSTFWLSLCYGSSSIFHWRWREMGMTALEDRISGLLTAFLSMDLPSMPSSAVLVAGQNIVFNFFFFFLPPFLLCKTLLKHLFIVKQSLISSVFPHNRKRSSQAYEMGQ